MTPPQRSCFPPAPWPRTVCKTSTPGRGRVFLLEHLPESRVAAGLERGPIECRFQAFAIGGAKPEFYRQPAFADARVLSEGEAVVEFDLQFGRCGLAVAVPGVFGVKELKFPAIGPGQGCWRQFVEPAQAVPAQKLDEGFEQFPGLLDGALARQCECGPRGPCEIAWRGGTKAGRRLKHKA